MLRPSNRCSLRVLLVDGAADSCLASAEILRDAGHEVHIAGDGQQAVALMTSLEIDVVVTADAEVQPAIAAPEAGDHLGMRLPGEDVAGCIERIAAQVSTRRELVKLRVELARLEPATQIVGRSTVMCRLMDRLNTVACSDAPVLLVGEIGTGKELLARALHDRGPRRGKPFVAVDCAAFPESLLEAERLGGGGTLLLDEVGEMSPPSQIKLLRILEAHTVRRIGTNAAIPVDVRVISATHRDLRKMTRDGLFCADLYRRLNVLAIDVPPLRRRDGDLPLLAQYFLNKFRRRGSTPARISPPAWSVLSTFAFPGNVRQLGRAIAHATVMAIDGEIEPRHLPAEITAEA